MRTFGCPATPRQSSRHWSAMTSTTFGGGGVVVGGVLRRGSGSAAVQADFVGSAEGDAQLAGGQVLELAQFVGVGAQLERRQVSVRARGDGGADGLADRPLDRLGTGTCLNP